ncbi:MAG: S-layer homology domain-containing protein [Tissierellia bacterium]|nr:S-layer homology domain-containing protein [Tissierellia bacterium]
MKSKKIFVLMILLSLLISTTVNAITFVDISDHWAKNYILKVAENNLVVGFDDGTFRPEANVTVLQSLIMMSRLYKIDEDVKEQIIDKYAPVIEKMPNYSNYSWAIDDLCITIELGIVSESGLSNMFSEKTISSPASKEQIAILLTKAMMLGDKAKSLKSYTLPFNDVSDISTAARPYIFVMYDEGIVQGDNDKNINPKANITRAVIATMLDRAHSYIIENKIEPKFDEYNQTTTSVNGTITEVSIEDVESYIYIEDDNGTSSIIRINNNTKLYLNDKITTIDKINKDMMVDCEIDDQRIARVVEADNQTKIIKGTISYVSYLPPAKITIIDSKDKELTYDVPNDVKVFLDGNEIQLKNLKQKDIVTLSVKDNIISQIKSTSRIQKYDGKITAIDYSNLPLKITVKNSKNDKLITFEYTSEVQVTRNDDKSSFDQVRVGDDVTVTTEYDKMIQINTNAADAELSGTIKEILIAPQSKIKIADAEGKVKEYSVSSNVKINIGTKNSTIYDLRLGYYVDVNTSGDQIVTIEAEEITTAKSFSGKIVFVNENDKLIMMQNITDNGQRELIYLRVTNSTKIFNTSGNTKYLKNINEGENIICTAISQGGEYVAVSIMIQ